MSSVQISTPKYPVCHQTGHLLKENQTLAVLPHSSPLLYWECTCQSLPDNTAKRLSHSMKSSWEGFSLNREKLNLPWSRDNLPTFLSHSVHPRWTLPNCTQLRTSKRRSRRRRTDSRFSSLSSKLLLNTEESGEMLPVRLGRTPQGWPRAAGWQWGNPTWLIFRHPLHAQP